MRATVKWFEDSNDEDLESWKPPDPGCVAVWVRVFAGMAGSEGADCFDVGVCTPKWIAAEIAQNGPLVGRHFLLIERWDFQVVKTHLTLLFESEKADSWEELATRLGRFGHWEFEDYVEDDDTEEPSVPVTDTCTCPVCGYSGLSEAPRLSSGGGSYEICYSCGFEFGVSDDDEGTTYEAWRAHWIEKGMHWSSSSEDPPKGWDPTAQIAALLDET